MICLKASPSFFALDSFTVSFKSDLLLLRGEDRYFYGLDFIAQLTLHIPPKGKHVVRRYGVYSSRSRCTWKKRPALKLRAAEKWYGWGGSAARAQAEAGGESVIVTQRASRKAWARLLARVLESKCKAMGAKINYNCKVNKILLKKRRAVGIELENGIQAHADLIISAADGYATIYNMLDGKFINKKINKRYKNAKLW